MALTPADLRILIKRSTNTGEVPTAAPSTDHTDGTWDSLDIYKGELFINVADDKLWMRTDSGIVQLYPSAGGITSLNGLTAATQTFAVGTSGTDFTVSSVTSTHTFNLPTASASARGALSSSDWTTFNNKIGGSLTSGRVPYASGASTLTDTSLFVFDGTKLGVGIASPTATIHSKGSDSTSSNYAWKADNSSSTALFYVRNDGNWSNSNTSSTDRWSDMRHTGGQAYGYIRVFTRNNAGNLDGYNITTAVQSGNSTTAVRLIAGDTGNQVSEGLVSGGGTGNQSWGVRGSGGNALISVGVQGSVTIGGSSYAAAVLGSASGTAGTGGVSYAVWGNHTGTAAVNKYGGYFDSSGANGTNVGGYFRAVNGGTNYAIVTAGGNSGFGTTTPNASAIVEMASTTQGFLPPRMTGAQAEAIAAPATGLLVYATSGTGATITTTGWWGYDGSTWVKLN